MGLLVTRWEKFFAEKTMQFEMNLPMDNISITSSQGPVAFEVVDGLAEFQKYQVLV